MPFFAAVALALTVSACGGGGGSSSASLSSSPAQQTPTTAVVSGKVQDKNAQTVTNAEVQVGGQTVVTDTQGRFSLTITTPGNDTVVQVRKAGFASNAKLAPTVVGRTTEVVVPLFADQVTATFNSASGTTLEPNGAKVSIPANAIQTASGSPYSGTVTVAASYHNPDTLAGVQGFAAPYDGIDSGTQVPLITAGVIEVKLSDAAGNALQIKAGSTANLTFPANSVSASAASIPLWYYDETAAIWKREGAASLQGDGTYLASVSHFTLWNMDFKGENATIKACFKDVAGNAATQVGMLELRGSGWSRTAPGDSLDGQVTLIRVPAGRPLELLSRINPAAFASIGISALAPGEVRQLACATVTNSPTAGSTYAVDAPSNVFTPPGTNIGTNAFAAFAGFYTGTFSGQESGTLSFTLDSSGSGWGTWVSTSYAPRTIMARLTSQTMDGRTLTGLSVGGCTPADAVPGAISGIVLTALVYPDGSVGPAGWMYCSDAGKPEILGPDNFDGPDNFATIRRN